MEVKIGVQNAARELTIDTTSTPTPSRRPSPQHSTEGGVFSLTDAKGRRVVVPGDELAYVDIATGSAGTVGFRS